MTEDTPTSPSLQDAVNAPWRHNLMGLLRRLGQQDRDLRQAPPIGQALRPSQESFRLGQQASLTFAPREVASVSIQEGRTHVRVFGLGLLGPNGPLPIHVTEWVRERTEARRDSTMADFLDLFHHRYLTHLYRAWAQSQAAAGMDKHDDEAFTRYVAQLGGDEPGQVQRSALAPHARWATTAHRVRASRDPDGLVSSLRRFFGVPVQMSEFQMHWVRLEQQDLTQLGHPRTSGILGLGAVAGEMLPDRQSRFRLVIGPLDLPGYQRLTPQGKDGSQDLPALVEMVRSFIGFEFQWEVQLLIHANAAPPCQLGDGAQLGWSSWMGHPSANRPYITGMVLEPEHYVGQFASAPASH
jgi:type VI secretion system protein ImpH